MAGLTKEQRAERVAGTIQSQGLIEMVLDSGWPAQPGMSTEAQVHPDEVERWQVEGWRVAE
ncbi:hypothetical protein [Serratia fonticola]|uniref:hypothetical protein n=1 Tax=Serratia fonticola TaxID=47917 RepID=UPI002178D49F|nr:hypothetical protein [Serratia fonticola]CAI1684077.1 Uncharacterised protein [Serratia fonticola]